MLKITVALSDGNDTSSIVGERIYNAIAETIALKNIPIIQFEDQFNGDLSLWNPVGTTSVSGGTLKTTGNGAINSGGVVSKTTQTVVVTQNDDIVLKSDMPNADTGFMVFGFNSSPTLNDLGTNSKAQFYLTGGDIKILLNASAAGGINTGFNYGNFQYTFYIEKQIVGWKFYVESSDDPAFPAKTLVHSTATDHSAPMYIHVSNPQPIQGEVEYIEYYSPGYSMDKPSPISIWTVTGTGTIDMSTFRVPENNNTGDAGTIEYQYAFNGAALGAWVNQAFLQGLGIITITDAVQSIKVVARYISDGTQKPTTDSFATVEFTPSVGASQPVVTDVRLGIVYNDGALTGTAAIPGPNDVRDGVAVDAGVGVYEPADPTLYANGEQYGANGTEFTGSKVVTQFQNPVEVILEDEEIILFEGD